MTTAKAPLPEDDPGLWLRLFAPAFTAPRPALFLDRDGVVVEEVGFLHEPDKVQLRPGIAELIGACHAGGLGVVIVTNQSGVGRALYGWREFAAVQARIRAAIGGAGWHGEFACGYHPDGGGIGRRRSGPHDWRKPAPGMLLEGARRLNLDLARSWIIGDRATDMAAGAHAGLAGGILMPGPTTRTEPDRLGALAAAPPGTPSGTPSGTSPGTPPGTPSGTRLPVHLCEDPAAAHHRLTTEGLLPALTPPR